MQLFCDNIVYWEWLKGVTIFEESVPPFLSSHPINVTLSCHHILGECSTLPVISSKEIDMPSCRHILVECPALLSSHSVKMVFLFDLSFSCSLHLQISLCFVSLYFTALPVVQLYHSHLIVGLSISHLRLLCLAFAFPNLLTCVRNCVI
jgi:hypothetical protein